MTPYYEKNREKLLEKQKNYYKANAEAISAARREKYAQNKEKIVAYQRAYREKNRTEIREKARKYYLENKEKFNAIRVERQRLQYEANREGYLEYSKRYYEENRSRILNLARERRIAKMEEQAKTDAHVAYLLWRSKLSPELRSTLRRRRIRERLWAKKVLALGVSQTFFDQDHGVEFEMTLEQAKEILVPKKKVKNNLTEENC